MRSAWKRNLGAPNLSVLEYFSGAHLLPLQNVEQKIAKKTKMMFELVDHSFCPSFSLFPYVNRQVLLRILRASWQVCGRRAVRLWAAWTFSPVTSAFAASQEQRRNSVKVTGDIDEINDE
jgi:hypothetical protein